MEIASPQELVEFFESLDYTAEAWEAGIRAIRAPASLKVGDAASRGLNRPSSRIQLLIRGFVSS